MPTVDKDLSDFVGKALGHGRPKDEIERALTEAGWPREQVAAALGAFADVDFPVPVPRPRPYISAREAFVYFVLFTALGLSAGYLGALMFDIIDLAFPDPTISDWRMRRLHDGIRWAISVLVIAFPLYLYLTHRTSKDVEADPTKRSSRVRKWLTYAALAVAVLFISGDLVTLVYNFLKGDLTIQIALKILTVAVVAGTVFAYYLIMMRRDERES